MCTAIDVQGIRDIPRRRAPGKSTGGRSVVRLGADTVKRKACALRPRLFEAKTGQSHREYVHHCWRYDGRVARRETLTVVQQFRSRRLSWELGNVNILAVIGECSSPGKCMI